jgi:L-lactate dehydrogenase complex protein LldG
MSAGGDGTGGGREQVLGAVRRALKRKPNDPAAKAETRWRLSKHPRGPIPARTDLDPAERVRYFVSMAEQAAATVARPRTWDEVPGAVAEYLRRTNRPAEIVTAPHPDLRGLNWAVGAPILGLREGAPDPQSAVGVSRALAGVAETGTLLLRSGADSPTTLNFLPATHIVVLTASDIVGPFEDAWDRLRAEQPDGQVPRTVNLVTGPSRTADIEQTLQLGAHGPMDLHILVVGHVEGRG